MKKSSKPKIGVGLVTYNRPEYFAKSSQGIIEHLLPIIDEFVIYNDGSDEEYLKEYEKIYKKLLKKHVSIEIGLRNNGVAHAKNMLFHQLLGRGCDYIFISEDDIVVQSPNAVLGYINLSKKTGIEHFNFAHHGMGNPKPEKIEGEVEYYPNCVGAYSFYTRKVLEDVGFMDENFKNAWEHVEHTARIAEKGYTSPFWLFADATDSPEWIKEIPGSIDHSSIKRNTTHELQLADGLAYWKRKDGKGIPTH